MFRIIKNKGRMVTAYRLGEEHPVLKQLEEQGKIVCRGEGIFEIFSQESVNGPGELAKAGDYVKIDSAGFPYPNDGDFFRENHRLISGNQYEQLPKALEAWDVSEPRGPEIEFLIQKKGLRIHESDPEAYYSAPLWGTMESAPRDAVVVFYSISRNEDGTIRDADFNFVHRTEFEKTYSRC